MIAAIAASAPAAQSKNLKNEKNFFLFCSYIICSYSPSNTSLLMHILEVEQSHQRLGD